MSRRIKFVIGLTLISIVTFISVYQYIIPSLIKKQEGEMKEFLELNGFEAVDMIDINAMDYTATWVVLKRDSLGNRIKDTLRIHIDGGYSILPK